MSFFGLPTFKLPTFKLPTVLVSNGRCEIPVNPVNPVNPVVYVQHLSVNKFVGCLIITDSLSSHGYDVLLPKISGQNSYGVFSGKIGGPYSDYDCTNTLMRSIHIPLEYSSPFIEFNDPSTGNPYKIYVKYMRRVDLSRLNASLSSSIASNDFAYFTRFPLSTVSIYHNFQTLNDDAGVTRFMNSSASAITSRIIQNLDRFI
jgi:hypothetical protein